MAEANYSLSPAARLKSAVFTRALYRAKDAVKRQLQAQGHKVAHYSSRDITILAQAYLDQHREELLPEAMQTVERWAAEHNLRTSQYQRLLLCKYQVRNDRGICTSIN